MTHPRLILHVGGAKCGSSAFQTALSAHDRLTAPDTPGLVYAALHVRRGLLHGAALRDLARKRGFGYISSMPAQDLQKMDRADRQRLLTELRGLLAHNDHVVLSNESWLPRHNAMAQSGFLDGLDQPFAVFAAVRPQIEFINSGWWQWGAWKTTSFGDWTTRRHPQVLWHRHLRKWQADPACAGLAVRLLSRDIVGDFLSAYGLTPDPELPQGRAANVSLPGELLRLFQRHPGLRSGPGKAEMDFILSQFRLGDGPTPWIVDPDMARQIIDGSRADNEALCTMLPEDQATRMRNTPGWWSADAYADRPLQSPLPQPVSADAAAEMQARATRAVAEMIGPDAPLAQPLPASSPAAELDARNARLVEALFEVGRAQRRQGAAP